MPAESAPALDLLRVDAGQAAAQVIAAVPLEPAARVGADDPALFAPDAERLAALHPEIVQRRVGDGRGFRLGKPGLGKFRATVVTVLALENTQFEHFLR